MNLHAVLPPYWWKKTYLSQGFGESPNRYKRFGLSGHNGIDFAIPRGTTVMAADRGRVLWIREDREGFGLHVKLAHIWGETLYAHLDEITATVGGTYGAGQPLALSGSTGYSTGPHLHFGMLTWPRAWKNGYYGYVDPLPHLPGLI